MHYDKRMSEPDTAAQVRVCFSHAAHAGSHPEEQGASYCASGHVFLGSMELCRADGSAILTLPVQSGGWMCEDSPFKRAGLYPPSPAWGEYDPLQYPDTAFPCLPGPTTLGTLRTGRYRGFRIPDPPGTGRSFLMVHSSTRYGSEGCISCPPGEEWELFCEHMARLHSRGVQSLPIHVTYTCPGPDALRCPHPPVQ